MGECERENSSNTTVTVYWQCSMEEPHNKASCDTLSAALTFTISLTKNCSSLNISIDLESPNEILQQSVHIANVSHFNLTGVNSTMVNCSHGTYLQFEGTPHNKMNVDIGKVTFSRCGNGEAALSFSGNCDITLNRTVVTKSNGSGLLLKEIAGNVAVGHSEFNGNNLNRRFGAGVHISSTGRQQWPISRFSFFYCYFTGNKARNDQTDDIPLNGGGMYVSIGGNRTSVTIAITHCHFSGNDARRGAGLYVSFNDTASCNQLTICRTNFQSNQYSKHKDLYNAGGAALISTLDFSHSNALVLQNCSFLNNKATWGGAVGFFASPTSITHDTLNNYSITDCRFLGNNAKVGSAISIYCKSAANAPDFCSAYAIISGLSEFTSNGKNFTKTNTTLATTVSTVNIDGFTTRINGTMSFKENTGSPLFVRDTALVISQNSHLTFNNNTAETGGGIALYDSWMTVSHGSQLIFRNNTALTDGGAIYVHQSEDLYVPHAHNCFIRYENVTCPPWYWDSMFHFSGNKVNSNNNSIYATSIIPCVWNYSIHSDLKNTFCKWGNWSFNHPQNCTEHIATAVSKFGSTQSSIHVAPGVPTDFVVVEDELGHKIQKVTITPMLWPASTDYKVRYNDDGLVLFGPRNRMLNVLIQVDGNRNIFKMINVTVGSCPPGFVFANTSCECYENKREFLQCHGRSWNVSLMRGFCVSFSEINHHNQTVLGRCMFSDSIRSLHDSKYYPLPMQEEYLDEDFCQRFNRTGLLCGQCMDGLSIDVLSETFDCHNCYSSFKNWVIFLTVGGLPPLVLFLVILLFHISFIGGSTNGFIFLCQVLSLSQEIVIDKVITSYQYHSRGSLVLVNILVDMYSVWSLDTHRIYHSMTQNYPLCLGEKLRVIDVLALHYLLALYPFVLIVIAYIVIELHARNCRALVFLWKPLCLVWAHFRRSLKPQTSLVDAFATFIILSYVKLIRLSLLLMTFTDVIRLRMNDIEVVKRVSNYDPTVVFMSREHIPFVLLGSFFFITFGVLPPLLLLFYQFRAVQRCLTRCKMNRLGLKTFMDAFQGCYSDGRNGGPDRRFFAGLYLIFRVVIFVIFNLQIPHIIAYFSLTVTCIIIIILIAFLQPYKVMFFNKLDIVFAFILASFFGLHILGFSYFETTFHVPTPIIGIFYCLSIIPFIYILGLILLRIFQKCCLPHKYPLEKLRRKMSIAMRSIDSQEECRLHSSAAVTYSEVAVETDDDVPDSLASSSADQKDVIASNKDSECHKVRERTYESGYMSLN